MRVPHSLIGSQSLLLILLQELVKMILELRAEKVSVLTTDKDFPVPWISGESPFRMHWGLRSLELLTTYLHLTNATVELTHPCNKL